MSTLPIVELVLRESGRPMTAREIVKHAGARLPSRSKTPDTVVARDLAVNIKRLGEGSPFVRTAPGLFTLRELLAPSVAVSGAESTNLDGRAGALNPAAAQQSGASGTRVVSAVGAGLALRGAERLGTRPAMTAHTAVAAAPGAGDARADAASSES